MTFLQYGAGNIGRGFLGQLFGQAGYEVCFIDVNREIIAALNQDKRYPVNTVSAENNEEIWIENVRGVDGTNISAVEKEIANADYMATAVGVNILPKIVPVLSAGLKYRWKSGNMKPLNIIICENLIDADKYLHSLLNETFDEEEKKLFTDTTALVEASIGRMVPVMTDGMKNGNILRVCVESYQELPVDGAAWMGELPDIPQLHPFTPFEFYIRRKLFIHNMGHAMAAYLGNLCGYEYIWQAIENPYIKLICERAMLESAACLSEIYNIPLIHLQQHIFDLLSRFANKALGDTVERVGRDTLRKLSKNDRFCGAVSLCEKFGISTSYISIGIAAGSCFKDNSEGTTKLQKLLYEKGIDYLLKDIYNINESIKYICNYFNLIKSGAGLDKILYAAETNCNLTYADRKII